MRGRIPIAKRKVVTCNRCGCPDLAWHKSKRTGRFYLCQVLYTERDATGHNEAVMVPAAFHNCEQYQRDKLAYETTECPGCKERIPNRQMAEHVAGCSQLRRLAHA